MVVSIKMRLQDYLNIQLSVDEQKGTQFKCHVVKMKKKVKEIYDTTTSSTLTKSLTEARRKDQLKDEVEVNSIEVN